MKSSLLKQHYNDIKIKYPNAIIFFRVGDYYEIISQDAVIASNILGITLTNPNDYEQAGFSHDLFDKHLRTIIKAGYTVAIVDTIQ